VYLSDRMAAQLNYGFRGDLQRSDVEKGVCDELGMSLPQFESIKAAMPKIFEDVQATFGQ
jgi:hypothetical protein